MGWTMHALQVSSGPETQVAQQCSTCVSRGKSQIDGSPNTPRCVRNRVDHLYKVCANSVMFRIYATLLSHRTTTICRNGWP